MPNRNKNEPKGLCLSIKKSPSLVRSQNTGLLPKIGQDSTQSPLKKEGVNISPYRNKKMRVIKLIGDEREKNGKNEQVKSIRTEFKSKIIKKSNNEDATSSDDED